MIHINKRHAETQSEVSKQNKNLNLNIKSSPKLNKNLIKQKSCLLITY